MATGRVDALPSSNGLRVADETRIVQSPWLDRRIPLLRIARHLEINVNRVHVGSGSASLPPE